MTERRFWQMATGALAVYTLAALLATPTAYALPAERAPMSKLAMLWLLPVMTAVLVPVVRESLKGAAPTPPDRPVTASELSLLLPFSSSFALNMSATLGDIGLDDARRIWSVVFTLALFGFGFIAPDPDQEPWPRHRMANRIWSRWRWIYLGVTGVAVLLTIVRRDPAEGTILTTLATFGLPGLLWGRSTGGKPQRVLPSHEGHASGSRHT